MARNQIRRQWWQMTRATLDGPDIHAVSAMPGIDWFTPYPNGYGRPHVRLPFHTSDGGALILLEYQGIVHASDVFVRAVERDTSTQWDDQCMRMALIFDTTADRYAWLDELHEAWNSCGARIVSKPESKPWHLHEFTATDEDGNLLRVFYDFAW